MLKWLHPGCRGNVFECYFQPISGCVVTAEEIERAKQLNHTSTNGDFFDAYPLRDERVLLLHGLPVSDPCGLCMDQVRRRSSSIHADSELIRIAVHTVADEWPLLRRALCDGCEVSGGTVMHCITQYIIYCSYSATCGSKPIPPEEAVHASEDSEPGHHYRAFMVGRSSNPVPLGEYVCVCMILCNRSRVGRFGSASS